MAAIRMRRFGFVAGPLALVATLALPLMLPQPAAAQGVPGIAGPYLAAENAARRGDIAESAQLYAEALSHDTGNPDLMDRAMTQLMAAGQIPRAIPIARRLDAIRPGNHLGNLLLAADALSRGEPAKAREALVSGGPDKLSFVGRIIDAWAAYDAGDVDGARAALTALAADRAGGTAGEIVAAYHLGLLDAAVGDDAGAIEALARSAEKAGNGGTFRLARIRAGALARLGRIDEARAVISDRLSTTLGDKRLENLERDLAEGKIPTPLVQTGAEGAAEGLFGVSGFLSRSANWLAGLAYSQLAIHLDPKLVEARLLIASILNEHKQYDLAITAYAAIPDDAPEALDAMIGQAGALRESDRVEEAIALLRRTVARFPRSIDAHTALGDVLRRESRFAEAAEAYDGAIALIDKPEKQHWPLYYQRGIAFERSKQWPRAEKDFREALELAPDQPLVLNYLGYSWVEMGEHLDEAQAMIEKAVEKRPEDGYIVDSLGWVLYRLGDFPGAAKHLERAVELQPVDPVINDHFGDALWMVGRRNEAVFQWKRALSFEPEEKDAKRIRRKLAEGLDKVLTEEAAAGSSAIIGTGAAASGDRKNGG